MRRSITKSVPVGLLAGTLISSSGSGCAGPPPTDRVLQAEHARAYDELLAVADTPKAGLFATRSAAEGVPEAEIALSDADLRRSGNPFRTDDAVAVSRGAVIYLDRCLSCHGEDADGQGWAALPTHPADSFQAFTKRLGVGLAGGVPGEWFDAVADGKGPEVEYAEGPRRAMPAFSDELANEQIWLVLTYLAAAAD